MRKAALLISATILLQISLNTGDAQESDSASTPDVARLMLAIMGADTPTPTATQPTPTSTPSPTPTATQPTPTSTPSQTPTETPVPKCFPHDTAYLIGDMNIREEPTTNSKRVGRPAVVRHTACRTPTREMITAG